jgi:DNA-binding MarR family transcriptional regulator
MQELGNRVVLSRSRVSRIVEELSQAELARREPDPNDGRGSYAAITASGRSMLRSAAPVYLRGIAEHFTNHLDDRQLRAIHDALSRIVDAQERSADPLPR